MKDKTEGCPYQNNTVNAPSSQQLAVKNYLDSLSIQATQHPSGFFYQVVNPGTGTDSMGLCSQVYISYKGQLTNETVFDQQQNVVFVLGSLIEGWRKGLPLLKKGGEINLYIPPSLGYGSSDFRNQQGVVVIPGNSILKFNVKLHDFTPSN